MSILSSSFKKAGSYKNQGISLSTQKKNNTKNMSCNDLKYILYNKEDKSFYSVQSKDKQKSTATLENCEDLLLQKESIENHLNKQLVKMEESISSDSERKNLQEEVEKNLRLLKGIEKQIEQDKIVSNHFVERESLKVEEKRELLEKLPSLRPIGPIKFSFHPIEENKVELKQLETVNRLSRRQVKKAENNITSKINDQKPKWNYFYHSYGHLY